MELLTTFEWVTVLLPLIVAVHNVDEYARYDDFVRAYHSRFLAKRVSRPAIRNTLIAVTLFAAVIAGLAYVRKGGVYLALCNTTIFAFMENAIGHCLLSLKRRTLVPGTLSAAVLVLPYSIVAIASMRADLASSYSSLLLLAACGAVAMPLFIIGFLWLGYGISRLPIKHPA
jgi:hypothetical protein